MSGNKVYYDLFEYSSNLIILLDSNGKIIDINNRVEQFFELSKDKIIGKQFSDVFYKYKDFLNLYEYRIRNLDKNLQFHPKLLKFNGTSGKEKELMCDIKNINGNVGEQNLQLTLNEKVNYFEFIKNTKKQLKIITALYNNFPNLVILANLDGTIMDCNLAIQKLFRLPKNEIVNKNFEEIGIFTPKQLVIINERSERALRGDKLKSIELKIVFDNIPPFWIEMHTFLIEIDNYLFLEYIISDISNIKATETLLYEAQQKFKNLAETIPEAIYECDLDLNLTYVNSAMLSIFGYTEMDVKKGLKCIDLVHPSETLKAIDNHKKLLEGKKTEPLKIKMIRKDDSSFYSVIHARPIVEKGEIKGITGIIYDVTKEIEAAQKIKASKTKYEEIVNLLPEVVYEANLNLDLTYINSIAFDTFKCTEDDLEKGINLRELICDESIEIALKNIKSIFNGKITDPCEYKLLRKDQSSFYALVHSRPIYRNGKVVGIRGVVSDISERIEMEQALLDSEIKFRTIAEQSIMGIAIIQDDVIKYANSRFTEIFGQTVETVLSWGPGEYLNFVHPDDRKFNRKQSSKKQAGEKDIVINYVYRGMKKDGSPIWVENYSKSILYQGKPADFVTLIDITAKNKAEDNLKKSEEKYSHLIKNISDIIIELDDGLRIEYASPQIYNLLGYKPEDILGKRIYKFIHIDDVSVLVERLKGFILKKPTFSYEYRFQHRNGIYLYMSTVVNEYYVNGIKHYIFVQRDITRNKHAEELYQEEIRRLKDLDKLRRDFINRASHELKTPLTSIYGSIQLLYDLHKDQMISSDALELLEIAKKGGVRLKNLVFNLLDISRLELKKFKLNKGEYDVLKVLNDCIDEMKYLADKRNLSIRTNFGELDTLILKFDKIRIEQVFINLISNAINNTPYNGLITVTVEKLRFHSRFCIEDTGIGLTKDEINKIFKKFSKIERYGMGMDIDTEGTGLGLFISKEIINLHRGKIWASSLGRNQGAKFCFTIPDKDVL